MQSWITVVYDRGGGAGGESGGSKVGRGGGCGSGSGVCVCVCLRMSVYVAVGDGPTVVWLPWLRYKSSFTCVRSLGWH